MTFHAEILDDAQQRALASVAPMMTNREFYLAGGTAIALHLGHRHSVDLDWFTHKPIDDAMRLAQDLRNEGADFSTKQVAPGTLHGSVEDVPISLLEYDYELLEPLVKWPTYGCQLAALDDLACMKLAAIAQRGAKKDFLDVYALGARHRPLPELLDLYRRKYRTDDIAHLLYALTYFDDAEEQQSPVVLWDVEWPDVKNEVCAWVNNLV